MNKVFLKKIASSVIFISLLASCQNNSSSVSALSSKSDSVSSLAVSSSETSSSSKSESSLSSQGELPATLSFFSLNDTHGAIEESASTTSSYYPGLAKLSTLLKMDTAYDSSSVLLSSGDMFQGSALSNMTKGLCMTAIMNEMGFASMEIGNHEFDWSTSVLQDIEKEAAFPFLGINIYLYSTGKLAPFAKPSTVITRGNAKIGIVGSIYHYIAGSIASKMITDVDFKDDTDLVINEAKRLKEEEKCNIVIVSTHQGYGSVPKAFLNSSYIDGVFGGHDHQFTDETCNDKKFIEGGSSGKGYSRMVFSLDGSSYKLKEGSFHTFSYPEEVTPDSDVTSIISKYNADILPIKNEVKGARDGSFVRYYKEGLGSMFEVSCASMMALAASSSIHADCAFQNMGGVRTDWTASTPNSSGTYDITYGDVYEAFPFDNLIEYESISGERLLNACALSSLMYSSEITKSGTTYLLNGQTINPTSTYTVVTIDYVITSSKYKTSLYTDGSEGAIIYLDGLASYQRDAVCLLLKQKGTLKMADFSYFDTDKAKD